MKRLFTLFLSFLFLTVSVGFTTSTHVCKGVKMETRLLSAVAYQNSDTHQNKVCPVCAARNNQKVKKDNCCKNEAKQIRLAEKVEKTSQQHHLCKLSASLTPARPLDIQQYRNPDLAKRQFPAFAFSIPLHNNPLYLLNCVYRI